MATAGSEARFAHLLEPIRELAQNWSIDIAHELEEYLSELESITISFDDGKSLDFAEAALLIQGSACVYSKKVEHLYALVYNTLNHVVEKKRAAAGAGASQPADGEGGAYEEEEEDGFTVLDETLKEVDNLSLPPAQLTAHKDVSAFTQASAPLALLPQSGESNAEAVATSKMHECALHVSGALLLPHVLVPGKVLAALPAPPPSSTPRLAPPLPVTADTTENDVMVDDNDDNEVPDYGDADDSWQEALDAPAPPDVPLPGGSADVDGWGGLDGEGGGPPNTPAVTRSAGTPQRQPATVAPVFDPWAPLDPHDPSGAARRPFCRGRTYSAPPEAAAEAAEAEVAAAEEEEESAEKENASSIAVGGGGAADILRRLGLLSSTGGGGGGAPSSPTSVLVPLHTPLWNQFGSLHSTAATQRAAARKQRRQEVSRRQHLPSGDADVVEVEADALVNPASAGGAAGDGSAAFADCVTDGLGDVGGDAMTYDESYDGPMGGYDNDDEPPETFDEEPTQGTQAFGGRPRGSSATASYEDMCRAHVESCLQASASYHDDYELHRRVAEWQKKVEPLLDDELRRDEFDILAYADRLLNNFDASERDGHVGKKSRAEDGTEGTNVPFGELANTPDKVEVCRLFLATLQLTNQGNVEITTKGSIETKDQSFTVSLLSRQRRQIEM